MKKMKSYYGHWRTVSERIARVDGYDQRSHVWYGDLEGFGPTNWDINGKHLLNDQYDLDEFQPPIKEKEEDTKPK